MGSLRSAIAAVVVLGAAAAPARAEALLYNVMRAGLEQPQLDEPVAVPAPPPAAVAPAPAPVTDSARLTVELKAPTPPRKRLYTWLVGGLGLGLIGSAIGTSLASQLTVSPLAASCPMGRCDLMSAAQPQGQRLLIAADVLWSLGAVVEGVATALFFLEGRARKQPMRADLIPIFFSSGAGLALTGKLR